MERYSDYSKSDAVIKSVIPDSIADELGLGAGDVLLAINGHQVLDLFDFREKESSDEVLLLVRKVSGELLEFDIEKETEEELGLEFENPLLAGCESCDNYCVFCFIDQLPSGLRQSLYFKDDDSRLSFLTGNYVTLTNISEEELDRIIKYRFSPINISVHATNPSLRARLMGNKSAGQLLPRLEKIISSGIKVNAQFVLCPGLNDGEELERSLDDLIKFSQGLESIAVVPVGLTKHREANHLFRLSIFEENGARRVIEQVEQWQVKFMEKEGRRVVFASDEFYLLAKKDFPVAKCYEGFPQLENGVGMSRLFMQDISYAIKAKGKQVSASFSHRSYIQRPMSRKKVRIATGVLGAKVLNRVKKSCEEHTGLELNIQPIRNHLFGDSITVTGLVTGQDLYQQVLSEIQEDESLLICESMLKQDEDIFLDDWTIRELSSKLARDVFICSQDGKSFLAALMAFKEGRNV